MKKLFAVLMSIMMIACFMPTMAFADDNPAGTEATSIGISRATLHDTRLESTDDVTKGIADADLFDTYEVSDDGSTITITVKNLAKHQNGASPVSLGKWVGFVLPNSVVEANKGKTLRYRYNTDDSYNPLTKEQIATELEATGQEGIAFYFNLEGNQKNSFSYYFGDENAAPANVKTLRIEIKETYDHPNQVILAPLVDKAASPQANLYDKYNIDYKESTGKATITVKNLKAHTNDKKNVGKWVGIAVPVDANVEEGVSSDGIIYKLNDGKENNVDFIHKVGDIENYDERWTKDEKQYISFYFNAEAPEGLTLRYAFRNSSGKRTKFKTVDANVMFEQDASKVTFAATDANKGTLSGLVTGGKYTVNGVEFTAEGETHEVKNITKGELKIVKKAKETNETDSDERVITVDQAAEPTVTPAACTTADNNDGKLTGVTTAMQYKLADAEAWTDISADAISDVDSSITLPAGTYYVRVKASGTTLASTNQEVTIEPYKASTFSVTITRADNMTKTSDSGEETQENLSGAMASVVYEAADGYYFPEGYSVEGSNGITVTRDSFTRITVSGTPNANATIRLVAPTAKVAADTPNVTFTATGYDTGKLTNVESGLKYKIGNGDWTDINGNEEVMLTTLKEGKLLVVRKGGDKTLESPKQEITIERQIKPEGLTVTQPAATDGKGSIATTTAHEWTVNESAGYTSCTGALENLKPGTYHIRVKAADNKLASECAEYEIKAYTEPAVATATIDAVTISGKRGTPIKDTDIKITLKNEAFKEIKAGTVVTDWINLPAGLAAKIKDAVAENANTATITISGTATVAYNNVKLKVEIPATSLKGGKKLTVSENEKAVFAITNPSSGSSGGGGGSSVTPTTPSPDVKTDTKTGTTTVATDVKVSEKTNADGTKEKVAEVKVSAAKQKEILKQAKAGKSKDIVLSVSKSEVGDAGKADVTLDKSFIESIAKDTDAKLTIQTPFGEKTYTKEELKKLAAEATGSTITMTIEPAADDSAAKIEKAKEIVADMQLVARSSKTAKKSVKVVLKTDDATKASIEELKALGFTVEYKFYRSTKKAASYKATVTKENASYTNTVGKKGTKYFYKVRVVVSNGDGVVVQTALKQCKYASRTWTK